MSMTRSSGRKFSAWERLKPNADTKTWRNSRISPFDAPGNAAFHALPAQRRSFQKRRKRSQSTSDLTAIAASARRSQSATLWDIILSHRVSVADVAQVERQSG